MPVDAADTVGFLGDFFGGSSAADTVVDARDIVVVELGSVERALGFPKLAAQGSILVANPVCFFSDVGRCTTGLQAFFDAGRLGVVGEGFGGAELRGVLGLLHALAKHC